MPIVLQANAVRYSSAQDCDMIARSSQIKAFPAEILVLGETTVDGLERPNFLGLDILRQ